MKALVLHGYTSSVDTVSLLTSSLKTRGLEVSMPILRGHGTEPEHLFRVHWRDWVADAREALLELSPKGEPLVIAGLSMGSMVTCILAAEFPQRVKKIALLAPAFDFRSPLIPMVPLLKRLFGTWDSNPEYADPALISRNTNYMSFPIESFEQVIALSKVTEDLLGQIQCPVGTFYGKNDPVVPPKVLKRLDKKFGSGPSQRHMYKRSFHELLQDVEAELVATDVADYLLS